MTPDYTTPPLKIVGAGKVVIGQAAEQATPPAPAGELPASDVTCPECNGTGKIESDSSMNVRSRRCRRCEGKGRLNAPQPAVELPTGPGVWENLEGWQIVVRERITDISFTPKLEAFGWAKEIPVVSCPMDLLPRGHWHKLTLTAASDEPPAHPDEPRITGFGIDPKTSDLRHITFACNGKNVAAWRTGTGWKAEWEPLSPAPPAGDQQGERSAGIQATEVSVPPPGDAQPVARSPVDPPAAVELPTGPGVLINGKTPWEFACDWYGEQEIIDAVKRNMIGAMDARPIPKDVHSEEFGKWMAHEYRLAMRKGIEIGQRSQLRPASDAERELSIAKAKSDQWQGLAGKLAETVQKLTAQLAESETIRKNLGRICEVNEAFHWRLADLFDEGVRGVSPLHFVEKNIVALKEKAANAEARVRELEALIAADCRDWAEFDDLLDAMGAPKGDKYGRPATIERLEWVKDQLDTALAANAKLRTSLEKIATAEHSIIDGRYVNMQDFAKAALSESTVPQ